jgi:alpha-mannosidase
MVFATGLTGARYAGMPFDLAPRPARDEDLLPTRPPEDLARVLLGQREVGAVETFPFQEYVVLAEGERSAAVFARGLHAYSADEQGTLRLVLSRAVEWLTRSDLSGRVGDAGPFFYVPGARGERTVRHVVGAAFGHFAPDGAALQAMSAAFQNPPLMVRAEGRGTEAAWVVLREAAPLSSLQIEDEQALARFYNPTPRALPLAQGYTRSDAWGKVQGRFETLAPGEIATAVLPAALPAVREGAVAALACLTPPRWRVSENQGRPDPVVLAQLEARAAALEAQSTEVKAKLGGAEGNERLRLLHRYYVLQREAVEAAFSLLLNQKGWAEDGVDRVDEEVAALGLRLNQLRIKRRIFDYVAQALKD